MPHDHASSSHSHAGHAHAAPPPGGAFSAAFATGIGLNLAFVVAETIGGWRPTRRPCSPMPATT
ncbi:hypothetical protein ACFQT0_03625 [Hymenobacter humi]|uniref:Cation transporter n=1 Tax=Hymenobacter humi TaxID=1411620 RepID=A0ABW2U1U8_9BACT